MRKTIFVALLLIALAAGAARAEAEHWTSNDELYYHINANCGGEEGFVPISEDAARAFDKYPCPVCIEGAAPAEGVCAAARGGTIVVRFSDAFLAEGELTGVFGWHGVDEYPGESGFRKLGEYLHGDAYNSFLSACLDDEEAEGRALVPYILVEDDGLTMNARHIGASWYVIVRPEAKFRDRWSMYWRVEGIRMDWKNGALYTNFDLQTLEADLELPLTRVDGAEPVLQLEGGGFSMELYRALDANIAVIIEPDAAEQNLRNARLDLSNGERIEFSGYLSGTDGIYCCTLSDSELLALQTRGMTAELVHVKPINTQIHAVAHADRLCILQNDTEREVLAVEGAGADALDASYRLLRNSKSDPLRCVVQQDGADVLVDNDGWIYECGDIDRLTPLIWWNGAGLFLTERCDGGLTTGERLDWEDMQFGRRYAGEGYGDSWRCGLVDENGGAVADCIYTGIAVAEDGTIQLDTVGGGLLTIRPIELDR